MLRGEAIGGLRGETNVLLGVMEFDPCTMSDEPSSALYIAREGCDEDGFSVVACPETRSSRLASSALRIDISMARPSRV